MFITGGTVTAGGQLHIDGNQVQPLVRVSSSGTLNADSIVIGDAFVPAFTSSSFGHLQIQTGGEVNTGDLTVGDDGKSVLYMSSSTLNSDTTFIGVQNGSSGSFQLAQGGANWSNTGSAYIGGNPDG